MGWEDAKKVAESLKNSQEKRAYLILSVTTDEDETNLTNHAINLGLDGQGKLYLFDSLPRKGSQILMWDSNLKDIKDYFQTPEGMPRRWIIREYLNAAGG
jgi:hypothetical protein